jgi:phosphorylcholine metabolism protein LicD
VTKAKLKERKSKYQLSGKNGEIALDLLKNVAQAFEKHGVTYWLDFGTLLGIVREGRILPWDDDMDISIFEEDREKVENIVMPEIKKRNFRTYTRYFSQEDETLIKGEIRAFRARNNRFKFLRGFVKIDIFVMYRKDDFYYWYELDAKHKLPAENLAELDTIEFNGMHYSKPKNHDAHLTYHYGDWRTPDKNFDAQYDNYRTLAEPKKV